MRITRAMVERGARALCRGVRKEEFETFWRQAFPWYRAERRREARLVLEAALRK